MGPRDVGRILQAHYKHCLRSAAVRKAPSKNATLKNRHAGETCYVLATGPSIKNFDLKRLKGQYCIALSNFIVHPDFELLNPEYYCIAPFHDPITEEAWRNWMTSLDQKTGKGTKFFFGASDLERNTGEQLFADKENYFIEFRGSPPQIIDVDLTKKLPGPQ